MRTRWILLGLGTLALVAPGCTLLDSIVGGVKDIAQTYNETPGLPALVATVLGPLGVIVNNVVAGVGILATGYGALRGGKKAYRRVRHGKKPAEAPKAA